MQMIPCAACRGPVYKWLRIFPTHSVVLGHLCECGCGRRLCISCLIEHLEERTIRSHVEEGASLRTHELKDALLKHQAQKETS